jgi:hypothetical protein
VDNSTQKRREQVISIIIDGKRRYICLHDKSKRR